MVVWKEEGKFVVFLSSSSSSCIQRHELIVIELILCVGVIVMAMVVIDIQDGTGREGLFS